MTRAELLELLARLQHAEADRCGIESCGGRTEHQVCRPASDLTTLLANARRAEAMALRARLADGEEPMLSSELDTRPSEPPMRRMG